MPTISTPVSSQVSYLKTGSGPALILLHGFPESSTLWRNITDNLSSSYTLIIPDLPGSGNSVLEKGTSMEDMAACVKAITDHEGIDKAIVAGHSMGGYAALAFAALFPEYVRGLSLVHSTTAADDEDRKKNRLKSIDLIRNGGKNAFVSQMIPNLFSGSFKQSGPAVIGELIAEAQQMNDDSLVNYLTAMMNRKDRTDTLKNAQFPVQWILGREDNIISYKKILDISIESGINFVVIYEDCGHMSMFENPRRLANDIKAFADFAWQYHYE